MPQIIDKNAVAASFSKAAKHYDQFAQLQRDIGQQLLAKIEISAPNNIIDLGCGTGYFSVQLNQRFPGSLLTCFDLSDAMLTEAKKRNISNTDFQLGDIDALPFAKNSIDLIYSNLVLQWSNNLAHCLQQIKDSLKNGGRCYLSTLLDGTLLELSEAWKHVDNKPHTNSFLSLETIQKIVDGLGFSSVVVTTETRVLEYDNVIEVMRALKGIGANHVHTEQSVQQKNSNTLLGRALIKQLNDGYSAFKNETGSLKLTYQVCYIEVIK